VAERRRGLVAEHLSGLEALVRAQANADGERRKEKEKVKNVYNNKIILILYYIIYSSYFYLFILSY
jgi:hypothetical protein